MSLILSVSQIFLPSFADSHPAFQEKIKEHRSKKVLRSQVPELYFPEYVEDVFQKFNPEERKILAILADLKILAGVNKKHFAPEREMTQAEAMIVVQRVFDFLERTFADSLPKSAQKVDFTIKHCSR